METFFNSAVNILKLLDEVTASAIAIFAFSLLLYLFVYNFRSPVSLASMALLACICITYAGDVALFQADSLASARPWLQFQWIGIAFTPAAYLHFSDALLRTTNAFSKLRRWAVAAGYAIGFILIPLAIWTELLVRDGFYLPAITQFQAGPLFWLFTLYFFATVIWGVRNIQYARQRCLTSASRQRMTLLAISFAAPALGVFPYMLLANREPAVPSLALLLVLLLANLGLGAMLTIMTYSVAFFGVFSPERVVKHNLVSFLTRGPLVATLVIFIVLALPKNERLLGLPRDAILLITIVIVMVASQLVLNLAKPLINRLIHPRDRAEIAWIRALDHRLLTTTDVQQALENVLLALCELMRVRTSFIINVAARSGPRLETYVGSMNGVETALSEYQLNALTAPQNGQGQPAFISQGNFWFALLKTQARDKTLGLLGVEARSAAPDLSAQEQEIINNLIHQAELALEDRLLQQDVFAALRKILPNIERVQRLRSTVRYVGSPTLGSLTGDENPVETPDFPHLVRDALTHYWGGPKLTDSPLLKMKVVQSALGDHGGSAPKALRSVLGNAIESLRPDGERRMTTTEWLLYNILELKFIQGLRVRDIAQRLAMSESDLYRKQRIAIEEVARALRDMEGQTGEKSPSEPASG
ncbi:MAG: histidine kinase N-terminal 7TM domain-containing protein [Anaerolineae bacterium]